LKLVPAGQAVRKGSRDLLDEPVQQLHQAHVPPHAAGHRFQAQRNGRRPLGQQGEAHAPGVPPARHFEPMLLAGLEPLPANRVHAGRAVVQHRVLGPGETASRDDELGFSCGPLLAPGQARGLGAGSAPPATCDGSSRHQGGCDGQGSLSAVAHADLLVRGNQGPWIRTCRARPRAGTPNPVLGFIVVGSNGLASAHAMTSGGI